MARAAMTIILLVLLAAPASPGVAEEGIVTCKVFAKRRCKAEECVSMRVPDGVSQFRAGSVRRCRKGKCRDWTPTDRTRVYEKDGKLDGVVISRGPGGPSSRSQIVYNMSRVYRDGAFVWTLTWSRTTDVSVFARFGTCEGNIGSLRTD